MLHYYAYILHTHIFSSFVCLFYTCLGMYAICFTMWCPITVGTFTFSIYKKNTSLKCIISIAHIMFLHCYNNNVRMSQVSLLNLGVGVTSFSWGFFLFLDDAFMIYCLFSQVVVALWSSRLEGDLTSPDQIQPWS